jgi:AraC-like DNA-binding protein/mannose-6-phosphate isomerase-like protein (cupin superfamily)
MTVDELPDLKPPDFGNVRDPSRPILSFAWHAPGAHRAASHSHARAHIILCEEGALWVAATEGTWLVPSGQAIWIPPAVHHEVYSHGAVSAKVLFVDDSSAGVMPARAGTVRVSALLGALVNRAVEYGNDYGVDEPAARLARVALDELATMEVAPLLLPISRDPRLARVMKWLIDEPASPQSLEELARRSGASTRTMARLFRDETGMTFTQWRTRLVLIESIDRLTRGASVTDVAADLGYATTSSFVFMFRTNLGVSPGTYAAAKAAR